MASVGTKITLLILHFFSTWCSFLLIYDFFFQYQPESRLPADKAMRHSYFGILDPVIHNLPETASIFSISTIKLARDTGRVPTTNSNEIIEAEQSFVCGNNVLPPHHHNHQNQHQQNSSSTVGGFESNVHNSSNTQSKVHVQFPHVFIAAHDNAYSLSSQRYLKSNRNRHFWTNQSQRLRSRSKI